MGRGLSIRLQVSVRRGKNTVINSEKKHEWKECGGWAS